MDFDAMSGDADVPDDEQLNEMMASYEGELMLYQLLDRTSARTHSKPALMAANEVPAWLGEECWPSKYRQLMQGMMSVLEPNAKQGKKRDCADMESWDEGSMLSEDLPAAESSLRKRKEIVYDDGLTDLQFQRMLENEQDMIVKQQQQAKALKKARASASEVHQELAKAVQELQKLKRADGSIVAALFLEKPSKQYYPDYYDIIETPISLKEISQRLRQGKYGFFEELELDFALMAHNARTYNTDQSPVFLCCETIRREFYSRASRVMAKFGFESWLARRCRRQVTGCCPTIAAPFKWHWRLLHRRTRSERRASLE
jgi:hypothetical protein